MKKYLLHKVIPPYPPEARHERIAGTVKLRVLIGVDGSVKEAEFISGPEVFVKSTINAVRQWKYKPPTASGQPVEVDTTVDVVFSLVYFSTHLADLRKDAELISSTFLQYEFFHRLGKTFLFI
jgi:TonB family protein